MSEKAGETIGELLKRALFKLHQSEHFDEYMRYLNSEWYYTPDDLRLARDNEKVWSEVKFPGRLKIEISALLDESIVEEAETIPKVQFNDESTTYETTAPDSESSDSNSWVKCWAPEHECYYFYNTVTQESSWEDPNGGDENAVYDVYQYNSDTQEWVVIEDNTTAYSAAEYDADGNVLYGEYETEPAETKNEGSDKITPEDKQTDSNSSAVVFTKPRNPNSIENQEALFTLSPNRPSAKSNGSSKKTNEAKQIYLNHLSRKNDPLPSGSPGSQHSSRKSNPRSLKPIRLNAVQLSDDDSGSDTRLSPKHISPKDTKKVAKPVPASFSGTQSDWESKHEDSFAEEPALFPATASQDAYDFFRDHLEGSEAVQNDDEDEFGAEGPVKSSSYDSNSEYPVRRVGAYADSRLPEKEMSAAYPYEYSTAEEELLYKGEADSEYGTYDASSKSYYHHGDQYDHSAGYDRTSGPELDAYYNDYREKKNGDEHYAEHYLDDLNDPFATTHGDYGGGISTKTEEEMVQESYYHHAAEPTAPSTVRAEPNDESHIIGLPPIAPPSPQLYTPSGRTRRYSCDEKSTSNGNTSVTYATPVPDNEPLGEDYFCVATSVENNPVTPGGSNNLNLMEIAMGSPFSSNDPTPRRRVPDRKPQSTFSKLFHMNLFGGGKGPAMPSTPPPPRDNRQDNDRTAATNPHSSAYRQARQEERQRAKQQQKVARDNRQEERQYSKQQQKVARDNNSSSGGGLSQSEFSDIQGARPVPARDDQYYHAAQHGEHHDLERRRKPKPQPSDAAASMASREKFYAAHGQESPYKHQHPPAGTSTSNRRAGAAQQEHDHLRSLQQLLDMGFEETESIMALNMCDDDLAEATQMLVESR